MPERIQLKRTKGWHMPENTASVARPGRWGNPYRIEVFGLELAIELFRRTCDGYWSPGGMPDELIDAAYAAHSEFQKRMRMHPRDAAVELRGKNLACWCKVGEPCHADVLLELANQPEGK